jgi:hypothetical protein
MTSRTKAKELFLVANYRQYAEQYARRALAQSRARIEQDETGADIEEIGRALERAYSQTINLLFDFFELYFVEKFTDDELDDLIKIYSIPVFQKMFSLAPDMLEQLEKLFPKIEKCIERELEALL